ncbi:hypothetical protein QWZ13_18180 [Reinekea marina]|uniref:hypothetical protein n=1 Tax=Reinekea marina TaxID=1310421 RepID=UPI0025B39C26|nr:hypothetical protein [Reinekea marina]MDN3650839.1 hypothetical protein [Reinekea marina]
MARLVYIRDSAYSFNTICLRLVVGVGGLVVEFIFSYRHSFIKASSEALYFKRA